jgi:hypothetical protein
MIIKRLNNPCMIFRDKEISLSCRALYAILTGDPFINSNDMDAQSLKEYFKKFTTDDDYKIFDCILEMEEKGLIELG